MVHLEVSPASVPGLFSQFLPAKSLNLTASPPSRLSDRLNPLGDRKAGMLELIANDRDNWGQRLKVLAAKDDATQDIAVAAFHLKSRPLVGVSSVRVINREITGLTHPTPQVVYATLSKKGADPKVLELSKIMGTSGVLIAKDRNGRAWMQVQGRNPDKNFPHGGNLGCSPAGLFRYCYSDEGTREEKIRRIREDPESIPVIPVGSEQVAGNITGEAREELGIKDKRTLSVSIVGIAHDDTSPHYEILTRVDSSLSVDEINAIANAKIESLRVKGQEELHPHDFTEAYSWIPATPEAIKALILNSPHSPATHIANWIAVARALVVERNGEREAKVWQASVIQDLTAKVMETSRLVEAFYAKSPEAFFTNLAAVERKKFAPFLEEHKAQDGEVKAQINKAAAAGNVEAGRIKKYLDKIKDPTVEILVTAAAMLKGVLHTPLDDSFDPRRIPEAQGLLSAVETFRKIRASGVALYDGTMVF